MCLSGRLSVADQRVYQNSLKMQSLGCMAMSLGFSVSKTTDNSTVDLNTLPYS